jgi:hypothetical protein
MLDLRLLNAEINAGPSALTTPNKDGKNSKRRGTGERGAPIEIFSFKQIPSKRSHHTLKESHLWNAQPLNRKYNLDMSAEESE